MYTDDMRRVFHNITPPKGFGVQLIDNEHFLTMKLDEKHFARMVHDEKIAALQYVINLKNALEQNGAIVLITREPLEK